MGNVCELGYTDTQNYNPIMEFLLAHVGNEFVLMVYEIWDGAQISGPIVPLAETKASGSFNAI